MKKVHPCLTAEMDKKKVKFVSYAPVASRHPLAPRGNPFLIPQRGPRREEIHFYFPRGDPA